MTNETPDLGQRRNRRKITTAPDEAIDPIDPVPAPAPVTASAPAPKAPEKLPRLNVELDPAVEQILAYQKYVTKKSKRQLVEDAIRQTYGDAQ